VQISTKLNRAHLVTGMTALILPCLGRTERDGHFMSCENSMGVVQTTQGREEPASPHLRSEPAIVAGIAAATLGAPAKVDYAALASDYDRIRDLIAAVVPGCEDYNARVRRPGGFYLPNAAREGDFKTNVGKAKFTVHAIPRHELADGEFLLTTIRSHDQFNTTIYGTDDRYRGIRGERRVVFMNREDMAAAGLEQGDLVDLRSRLDGRTRTGKRFAVVPYPIPRRCLASYFPEANVLVPVTKTAIGSNTPSSKSVVVTMSPSAPDASTSPAEKRVMP
jgi:anaerobic selenocysteine-containing dehydrogenase